MVMTLSKWNRRLTLGDTADWKSVHLYFIDMVTLFDTDIKDALMCIREDDGSYTQGYQKEPAATMRQLLGVYATV